MPQHDPIHLRPVRADDLPAVLRVQSHCYPPAMQEAGDIVQARIHAAGATSFVAECGGRVEAYVFAYRSQLGAVSPLGAAFDIAPSGDTLYIHDLSVAPAAAGRGLARRMVEHLHGLAAGAGVAHCALVSVQDSLAFWQRLGYRETPCAGDEARRALASYPPVALYMRRASQPAARA